MKIAIVDDEKIYRDEIEKYLIEYDSEDGFNIIKFEDGNVLLKGNIADFDIVFLDIEMPNIDGITLASELHKNNSELIIIYITSYISYVTKAIRNYGHQFLVKPIDKEELFIELDLLKIRFENNKKLMSIQTNTGNIYVKISDVIYIESKGRTSLYHMENGEVYENNVKFSSIYKIAMKYNFAQSHRCCLVNLDYIYCVEKDNVVLRNCSDFVPVSRSLRETFKDEVNIYMGARMI